MRLQHKTANSHECAGIAGRHARLCLPVTHGIDGKSHGRLFFVAQGHGNLVTHGDKFGGMHDLDTSSLRRCDEGDERRYQPFIAHEKKMQVRLLRQNLQCGGDSDGGTVVATHHIHRHGDTHGAYQVSSFAPKSW